MPSTAITGAFLGLVFAGCCMLSCNRVSLHQDTGNDTLLAEVYTEKLMLSELLPLISHNHTTSPEDSAAQVRNFVESWVREELLLYEAARNLPADINIDKLIQDYRESLLLSNYENVLVKTLLDTVVTESELRTYYARNKEQYQLEDPILRCHYIKLPRAIPEREKFLRLWNTTLPDEAAELRNYAQTHAADYLLQDSSWYRLPDIERLLPPRVLYSYHLTPGRVSRFSDQQYEYHLRVIHFVTTRESAPLSYVREQAKRYILHKRKIELLEKIKADIYQREISGQNVKIHI